MCVGLNVYVLNDIWNDIYFLKVYMFKMLVIWIWYICFMTLWYLYKLNYYRFNNNKHQLILVRYIIYWIAKTMHFYNHWNICSIFEQKEIEISANVFIFASSHLQIHKQKIHNIDTNCFKILNYNRILGVNQFRNFISADCTISKQKRLAVKSVLCILLCNIWKRFFTYI